MGFMQHLLQGMQLSANYASAIANTGSLPVVSEELLIW